jgi:hypothetical protein
VTQEGSGCKFKVEPLERTLFLGARSFFEVLPTPQDCSWLVQEASGITLLNGGSHKGSARIEYVVNETATFWRRHIDIYEANYRWRASHVVEIPVK